MHIQVTKGNLPGGSGDVLIGMDIITQGDFSITNKDQKTVFSFRFPSETHTDYVKEHNHRAKLESFAHGGNKKDRKKKPKNFGKNK